MILNRQGVNSNIFRILLIGTFRTFSISMISPYIGLLLYTKGMPLILVGIYYVVLAVSGALGQLFGGMMSDRRGRRNTMIYAQLSNGISLFAMGLSLLFPGYMLISGMGIIQNLFGSATFSAYNTYVGDMGSGQSELIKNYGLMRVGINLGWALGPLFGGVTIGFLGYSNAFLLAGVIILSSSILFWGLKESYHAFSGFNLSAIKDTTFIKKISPFILSYVFLAQFGLTLTIYETTSLRMPLTYLGVLYFVNGIGVVLLQYHIARFLSKRDPLRWLKIGLVLYITGFLLLGLLRSYLGGILAIAVVTIGENIFSPLAMTIANLLSKPEKRGTYLGAFGMLTSSARSMGSFVGSIMMSFLLLNPVGLWASMDSLGIMAIIALSAGLKDLKQSRA
ncbi:MAG: MFS transporter [Conexivisphaerales archaeon]